MMTLPPLGPRGRVSKTRNFFQRFLSSLQKLLPLLLIILCFEVTAVAQVNGLGHVPYRGWSTYSQQTIVSSSTVMNEQNILAQSDAMHASGLGEHGFQYINLDAGWNNGEDQYGRPVYNPAAFPTFIEMIRHIHAGVPDLLCRWKS